MLGAGAAVPSETCATLPLLAALGQLRLVCPVSLHKKHLRWSRATCFSGHCWAVWPFLRQLGQVSRRFSGSRLSLGGC